MTQNQNPKGYRGKSGWCKTTAKELRAQDEKALSGGTGLGMVGMGGAGRSGAELGGARWGGAGWSGAARRSGAGRGGAGRGWTGWRCMEGDDR
jgi:hypothetical protein